MKKLSLIMAMVLIVTIGGVYATWTYNEGTVEGVTENLKVEMAGTSLSTTKGLISFSMSEVKLEIDDAEGAINDYKADLAWSTGASNILIKFTPNAHASVTGIKLKVTITENFGSAEVKTSIDATSKTSVDIFTFATPSGNQELEKTDSSIAFVLDGDNLTPEMDPVTTSGVTLNLTEVIKLNGNIYLPTYTDYTEFSSALSGKQFTIVVSEYIATP
ncbi:MAG: hypothetical protein IJV77_06025 [Clostridia bacterium]|nr:hypothetical protein [Clostridia bacterium]